MTDYLDDHMLTCSPCNGQPGHCTEAREVADTVTAVADAKPPAQLVGYIAGLLSTSLEEISFGVDDDGLIDNRIFATIGQDAEYRVVMTVEMAP